MEEATYTSIQLVLHICLGVLLVGMSIRDLPLATKSACIVSTNKTRDLRKSLVEFHLLLEVVQQLAERLFHLYSPDGHFLRQFHRLAIAYSGSRDCILVRIGRRESRCVRFLSRWTGSCRIAGFSVCIVSTPSLATIQHRNLLGFPA